MNMKSDELNKQLVPILKKDIFEAIELLRDWGAKRSTIIKKLLEILSKL